MPSNPTTDRMILEALGVRPDMAAIALEIGLKPMTHCADGFEEVSIGRWISEPIDGRWLEFHERPCYHKYDSYDYDDTPPDPDHGEYEDDDPWGHFFVDYRDKPPTGYSLDQREAAIRHWKEGKV